MELAAIEKEKSTVSFMKTKQMDAFKQQKRFQLQSVRASIAKKTMSIDQAN